MLRLFDVRDGEGRVALFGFALLLLLIIAGHTVLEAARDALLLTGPGPKALGIVYMVIAVCAWPAAALAARAGARFGTYRTLGGIVAVAATLPGVLFFAPAPRIAIVVYVVSGVIASVIVPQFWMLAGSVLTAAQGRRLFGLIAAAGVLGGVLGSGGAAAALLVLPVRSLLLVSSLVFGCAAAALAVVRTDERSPRTAPPPTAPVGDSIRRVRAEPFLTRIALAVVLSSATLLVLDYCFKVTVARTLPSAEIGPFVARYYLAFNCMSLVFQVALGSAVIRRMGVSTALALTPMLIFIGAMGALATGGAIIGVVVMKAIDGSLRYSIHRVTGELMYLPVPTSERQRVKPLIDGALGRASQTMVGAGLVAAGGTWLLAPKPLAAIVTLLAAGWLVLAVSMRGPYMALLRRAISNGSLPAPESLDPIDLESAQLLVQLLASENSTEVVGAMNALARGGRQGLVPALVLLHANEQVLVEALDDFGASPRTDWIPLGRRLLDDSRETVRIAAARALARHDALDPARLARDVGWRVRGYAAVHLALRAGAADVLRHEGVASLLRGENELGDEARLGMLAAIADASPNRHLSRLLVELSDEPRSGLEWTELFARAAAQQKDPIVVARLLERIGSRDGREAVRAALVALGKPALDAACAALRDTSLPRAVRMHLPKTIARFGSAVAAERLLESIESEADGFVRYKSIRSLGVVATEHRVPIDRARVERLALENLRRHFHLVGLRVALTSEPADEPRPPAAERLLGGLLDDKLGHALERALRLLEAAHPHQHIGRVRVACLSDDAYARANAGELLDTLLRRRDQEALRALFRIVADDLSLEERLQRVEQLTGERPPRTRDEALEALRLDADSTVVELAERCDRRSARRPTREAVSTAMVDHA